MSIVWSFAAFVSAVTPNLMFGGRLNVPSRSPLPPIVPLPELPVLPEPPGLPPAPVSPLPLPDDDDSAAVSPIADRLAYESMCIALPRTLSTGPSRT